jgi:hypothetical protein
MKMSGSRRTPIDRAPRPVIDAESVWLFRRGTRLLDEGCGEDKEFDKIRLALHRRLGLRPWHPNVFDVDLYAPDNPHQFRDWKFVTSLRDQLAELAWPRPRLVREGEQRDEAGDVGHAEPPR